MTLENMHPSKIRTYFECPHAPSKSIEHKNLERFFGLANSLTGMYTAVKTVASKCYRLQSLNMVFKNYYYTCTYISDVQELSLQKWELGDMFYWNTYDSMCVFYTLYL